MYIRNIVVILNMVEHNKIINPLIWTGLLFVFKSQTGQAVTKSCEHESESRVHRNSYWTT